MVDLATIEEALAVISAVIKTAVDLGPIAIKSAKDAEPFAQAIYDVVMNKQQITKDQLALLQQQSDKISVELQANLPPEQDDDV